MDMTDAADPKFLEDLATHFKNGEVVNREFLKEFFESGGDLGDAPDLVPWGFGRPKIPDESGSH